MKVRIREGNDFDVVWAIKRAGQPEDLSAATSMKLTLVVYGLVIEHELFTVTDNVLSINIPKEVATIKGDYRLVFEYTLPDAGQPDGDLKCKTDVVPFRIVPFTAEADGIYTVNVTSDIAFGFKGDKGEDGDDAYQIWLDLGNVGTYEDFIAYMRQPAVDAGASISELEGEIQVSEGLRVQAETARVNAEGDETKGRVKAENERVQAEIIRQSNEGDRIENEATRVQNEAERISEEDIRQSNEINRVENEATRVQDEAERISKENVRQNSEVDRIEAEGVREQAESERVVAETARVNAEGDETKGRVKAENERVQAESEREQAFTQMMGEADDKIEEMDTTLSTYDGRVTQVESDITQLAGDVNVKLLAYTDSATTTRMLVPLSSRKTGMVLRYNDGTKWVEELYTNSSVIDILWGNNANWLDLRSPEAGTILASMLSDNYMYRGALFSYDDLNNYKIDGVYYCSSPINRPDGITNAILFVNKSNTQTVQTIVIPNDINGVTYRRAALNDTWYDWKQITAAFPLTVSSFTNSYNSRVLSGNFATGKDTLLLQDEGYYTCGAGILNPPPGFTSTFYLHVKRISTRQVVQIAYDQSELSKTYIRRVDTTTSTSPLGWENVSNSAIIGKKWLTMGDSITGVSARYVTPTVQLTKLINTNIGVGGTAYAIRSNEYDYASFVTKSSEQDFSGFDYLSIFFGSNDWNSNVPLGTIDSVDTTTICGAINVGLANIYASNPSLRILIITPIYRHGTQTNGIGLTMSDYADGIKMMAQKYAIKCLDANRESGINALTQATYLGDGIHPNTAGASKLSTLIAAALQSV